MNRVFESGRPIMITFDDFQSMESQHAELFAQRLLMEQYQLGVARGREFRNKEVLIKASAYAFVGGYVLGLVVGVVASN